MGDRARRLAVGLAVAGMVFAGFAALKTRAARAQQSPYTIPINVRRVILDVVVTDMEHHDVLGLKKRDFSVLDNGKRQEIRTFEAFDFDKVRPAPAMKLPDLPADTYMNVPTTPERGPLYVIVFDMVNMGQSDDLTSDQEFARRSLQKFLASTPAGSRYELWLLAKDLHIVQGFTSDPNKLLAAFDPKRKMSSIPYVFLYGANYGSSNLTQPFAAMMYIAKTLEGLPGRKNLIWMSSQFPVALSGPGNGMRGGAGSIPNMQAQEITGSSSVAGQDIDAENEAMRDASDTLNAAQVAVYPIDVQGLNPEAAWGGIDPVADNIAQETGGRAFYNSNDIARALEDAVENGGSYYEITYAPTNPNYDGQLHKVEVSLSKKGYNLEYRRFYYADDPNKPLTTDEKRYAAAIADHVVAHQPGDTMFAYMERGAPTAHQILFRAHVSAGAAALATPEQMANLEEQPAYFVIRKKKKALKPRPPIPLQKYTIDYLVLDAKAGPVGQQILEFAAGAYDAQGRLLNGISQNALRTEARGHAGGKDYFRAVQTLDVPTTAAWLRMGVRDVRTDRIGTIEIPLPLEQLTQTASGDAPKRKP